MSWVNSTQSNKKILSILAHKHSVIISMFSSQSWCQKLHLFRGRNHTNLEDVATFLWAEMAATSRWGGNQWLKLCAVSEDAGRQLIELFDPKGMELRRGNNRAEVPACCGTRILTIIWSHKTLPPTSCTDGFSLCVVWMVTYSCFTS